MGLQAKISFATKAEIYPRTHSIGLDTGLELAEMQKRLQSSGAFFLSSYFINVNYIYTVVILE